MATLSIESIPTTHSGVSSTAHLVHTAAANWIVLQEGSDLTLIDGGYPGHADAVIESIERIGARPQDIRAALLTHAHVDHIGGLVKLHERYGFDVYADPAEVGHARRDFLQQASPIDIAAIAYRPRVLRWLALVIPLGAMNRTGITDTQAFPDPLDLPGRPCALAAHGHTVGHSAYLVADGAALVSGDVLISGHPLSKITGAQCIPSVFEHDEAESRRSIDSFTALDATTLFPGHGPAVTGSVAAMAREALDR